MKKILLFSLCLLLTNFIGQNLFAGKHRVNNNPELNAEFTDIQTAIDAASAGDTIYIEGSTLPYESDSLIINTQLVIFGPGFYLEENDSTTVDKLNAMVSSFIVFNAGSSGSILSGLDIQGFGSEIQINADNIQVSRNHLVTHIEIVGNVAQTLIAQNYWDCCGIFMLTGENAATVFILNNIFTIDTGPISISEFGSGIIENNVFLFSSELSVSNSTIRNNICAGGVYVGNNTVSNNFEYITPSDFFYMTGSTDGQYQLKPGSPAIGAGYNGTDCGAFGGAQPYVLSGLPPVPHIYEAYIDVIGTNEDGLQVQIKAKTQN